MAASIRVTLYDSPGGTQVGPVTSDASRNDLRKGYQSICESVYEANSYSWSLAFTLTVWGQHRLPPTILRVHLQPLRCCHLKVARPGRVSSMQTGMGLTFCVL